MLEDSECAEDKTEQGRLRFTFPWQKVSNSPPYICTEEEYVLQDAESHNYFDK